MKWASRKGESGGSISIAGSGRAGEDSQCKISTKVLAGDPLGRQEDAKSSGGFLPAPGSDKGERNLKEKATYSVIFFASSVEAAVELAEKTR